MSDHTHHGPGAPTPDDEALDAATDALLDAWIAAGELQPEFRDVHRPNARRDATAVLEAGVAAMAAEVAGYRGGWRQVFGSNEDAEQIMAEQRAALADKPTAAPTRPTREQVREAIKAGWFHEGNTVDCIDVSTDAVVALLAGEGTAQPGVQAMRELTDSTGSWGTRASGEGTAPQPDDGWIEVTPDALARACDRAHASPNAAEVGHRDGFCLACAELRLAMSGEAGTAPQVPAEEDGALSILRRLAITDEYVEWSIEMAPSDTLQWVRIDRDSRSWEYFEPLSEAEQAAYRRVVAADGAPQEGDER